jgi:hypothetical protein
LTDNLFFLFCWEEYEAGGGMDDYEGVFPTLEDAWKAFKHSGHVDYANLAVLDNGNLKAFADSETFTRYLENGNRVVESGWRTSVEHKFIQMEAREQRKITHDDLVSSNIQLIVTGVLMPLWEDV